METVVILVTIMVMISLFFTIANYMAWRLFDRPVHALLWSVTFFLAGVQYALNLAGGADLISPQPFWVVANSISFALVMAAHWGHRLRLGLNTPRVLLLSTFIAITAFNAVIVLATDLRGIRLAIAPAFCFVNMTAISWILLRARGGPAMPRQLAAAAHFLFGLTQLTAAIIALVGGNDMSPAMAQAYHLANFLFMPALYVAMGVSVILLQATDLSYQLRVQALTDQLTGLSNRRGFRDGVERMLARAGRAGSKLVMVLCDVDHFKAVNDTYGHGTGDDALRHLAQVINACVRGGDEVGRIGGEEFALCLEGVDVEGAVRVAERINEELARIPLVTRQGSLIITGSFGVADAIAGDDIDAILQRADSALYRAKAEGRNTVRVQAADEIAQAAAKPL